MRLPVNRSTSQGGNMSEYYTITKMIQKLNCSESTIRRWVKIGKLPAPKQITDRVKGWAKAEVDNWVKDNAN